MKTTLYLLQATTKDSFRRPEAWTATKREAMRAAKIAETRGYSVTVFRREYNADGRIVADETIYESVVAGPMSAFDFSDTLVSDPAYLPNI